MERQPLEYLLAHTRPTLFAAGWVECRRDWRLPERSVPQHVLWICTGGGANFRIRGRGYALAPAELLFIPAHTVRLASHDPLNPLHGYVFRFAVRLYGVLDLVRVLPLPFCMRPSGPLLNDMLATAQRIVSELAAAAPGCVLAANGDCSRLTALLWRQLAVEGPNPVSLGRVPATAVLRLAPVFQHIEAHFANRLTLAELAELMHLHPVYFSALFKQVTGLSPLRFLANYRLERARELLLSSDLPVSVVATLTGYAGASHLTRVFREHEGMPPTDYRRLNAPLVTRVP